MAVLAVILAVFALSCCVYLWLELQKKLSPEDITSALSRSCEEQNKTSERSMRAIETEWQDMYAKFRSMAGRIDKNRGIETASIVTPEPSVLKRSDLLRKHRGG